MAHGGAREGKWRGNWRTEWVASTLHTTSEHGISSITTTDAHTSAASNRLNWRPCRFKWTRPFRWKTKSGFCACAITFQTQSTADSRSVLASWCWEQVAVQWETLHYVGWGGKLLLWSSSVYAFWALQVTVGCRQVAAFGGEEGSVMGSVLFECPDEGGSWATDLVWILLKFIFRGPLYDELSIASKGLRLGGTVWS